MKPILYVQVLRNVFVLSNYMTQYFPVDKFLTMDGVFIAL